uniref:Uncharacterized protein n=1 Tax=Leviviridae sp. TaxID=2027243 RepID=A0A514DCQ3_9VIRU|nr:MAG: hypothetical protein H4Bulk462748_000002 [Leviviridae sp.]
MMYTREGVRECHQARHSVYPLSRRADEKADVTLVPISGGSR